MKWKSLGITTVIGTLVGATLGGLVAALILTIEDHTRPPRQPAVIVTLDPAEPTPAPEVETPEPARVADLMAKIGCDGEVIGTQLFSRETGRCYLGKREITIAAFDSNSLRDQWVGMGVDFGGNFAVGDLWAAWTETPDLAQHVATKLGGKIAKP